MSPVGLKCHLYVTYVSPICHACVSMCHAALMYTSWEHTLCKVTKKEDSVVNKVTAASLTGVTFKCTGVSVGVVGVGVCGWVGGCGGCGCVHGCVVVGVSMGGLVVGVGVSMCMCIELVWVYTYIRTYVHVCHTHFCSWSATHGNWGTAGGCVEWTLHHSHLPTEGKRREDLIRNILELHGDIVLLHTCML